MRNNIVYCCGLPDFHNTKFNYKFRIMGKRKRSEKDKKSIQEFEYDLRNKAAKAVKIAHERIAGKRLKPHPHLRRTWIYV